MFEYHGWRKVHAMPYTSTFADKVNAAHKQKQRIKPIVTVPRTRLKILDPDNPLVALSPGEEKILTPRFGGDGDRFRMMHASQDSNDTI